MAMQLAWLPWLIPTLLLVNGIFSYVLGYRSRQSFSLVSHAPTSEVSGRAVDPAEIAPVEVAPVERVLVRPDLGLFFENESLRDQLARSEVIIAQTEHSLREAKAALARSEARTGEHDRVKSRLTRSVFGPRTRQVGPQ